MMMTVVVVVVVAMLVMLSMHDHPYDLGCIFTKRERKMERERGEGWGG